MARNKVEVESGGPRLKHLGFVRLFALSVWALALKLYGFVKEHSGPFRRPLSFGKRVFTALTGPFYRKFKGVPDDLLVFFDKKIDKIITSEHTPAVVKWIISQSLLINQQMFQLTQTFMQKAQVGGLRVAIVFTVLEFNKFLLSQFVNLWLSAIRVPSLRKAAGLFLPTATGLLEKYNLGIISLTKKGFTALNHLPIVPIDKIGNILIPGEGNLLHEGLTNIMGGLSKAIETGSTSLSPAPILNEATKVAGAAASAAQNVVGNVMATGSTALGSLPLAGGAAVKFATGAVSNGGKTISSAVGDAAKAADLAASAAHNVVGSVMETGSAALGSLPLMGGAIKIAAGATSNGEKAVSSVMGDAAKGADFASSAAQHLVGNVMETGSEALGSLPLVGGAMKIVTGAASNGEKKTVSNVAGDAAAQSVGSAAVGSSSLLGKAMKVAVTAASSGERAVNDAVQKGSSALESVPVVGDAAKLVNFGAASTHKKFTNVLGKFQ